MTISHGTGSWKGEERDSNKDDTLVLEKSNFGLFVVFDGVSSTKDAKVVIDLAKEYITAHFKDLVDGSISLKELFFDANNHVNEKNSSDGASTYVALLVDREAKKAFVSWLGDSRIYAFDKDAHVIKQITKDDADPNDSHIITKGFGFEDLTKAEFVEKEVDVTNSYLLCTDGFYEFFEEDGEDLLEIVLLDSFEEIKKALSFIIKKNNSDDATYLIVET